MLVKNKLGFLAIEYSGHGKSSGEFTKGNITDGLMMLKIQLKKLLKKINLYLLVQAWVPGFL